MVTHRCAICQVVVNWRASTRESNGLKIRWAVKGPCRFESGHRHFRFRNADFGKSRRSIRTKWEIADMNARPLFIPVILGTARQGRQSENVGRFVFEETKKRADVETELIDVRELPIETR